MMIASKKTIWGISKANHDATGIPYIPDNNTTINEKLGIHVNAVSDSPSLLRYFILGVGGPVIHDVACPTNATVYEHIPVALVPVTQDLTPSVRARYALRKNVNIDGINYIAYYAYKFTENDIEHINMMIVTNDGTSSLVPLDTNTSEFLNPDPNRATKENTAVVSICRIKFYLSSGDVIRLNKALSIIYGTNVPAIREVGICSGKEFTDSDGFVDVCQLQMHHYLKIDPNERIASSKNDEYYRHIEIGGAEPLY